MILQCEGCDLEGDPVEYDMAARPELARHGHEPVLCDDCAGEWADQRRADACGRAGYYLEDDDDRSMFADPGGRSALRAAGPGNPRNVSCPACHRPARLTPADEALGYQCDDCADMAEYGGEA